MECFFYFYTMKSKSVLILIAIGLVLLLMYSPLGSQGKLLLTKLLAPTPSFLSIEDQYELPTYQWRLKDKDWNFFSLEQYKGKLVFVSFWASWHLPSKASLESIERLYNRFGNDIVFLIVTDEERDPVRQFIKTQNFSFPITYRVVEDKSPFKSMDLGTTYVISSTGKIVLETSRISDWDKPDFMAELSFLLKQ